MTSRRLALLALLIAALAAGAAPRRRRDADAPTPGVKTIKDVVYGQVGDRKLHLDIDEPDPPLAHMPVIVYLHGGAWKAGSYHGTTNRWFASLGYFCVSVEYRLSGEAPWPAQITDPKAAIRWLRANAEAYRLDAAHIGVWGHSSGAHLAALLGTSGDVPELEGDGGNLGFSTRVQCVVDCFGPTNLFDLVCALGRDSAEVPDEAVREMFGRPVKDAMDLVRQADPRTYISEQTPPFLIQHGTKDRVVPLNQALMLARSLESHGVETILHQVKGADHGFRGINRAAQDRLGVQMAWFFNHWLHEDTWPKAAAGA
jgi:acetyl esterase/lipase